MRRLIRLLGHLFQDYEPDTGSRSWPEISTAALKPDQPTWLVARAITLRGF